MGVLVMCMLYGFSASDYRAIQFDIKEFVSYSNIHRDGWGLYRSSYRGWEGFKSNAKANANNPLFNYISTYLCIAHIRKATRGKNTIENTHPFTRKINGVQWVYAHNGTVQDGYLEDFSLDVMGDTDSERAFAYIASQLEDKYLLTEQISCIEAAVSKIAAYGKFNMLLSDGERLYVHSNLLHTLYYYQCSGMVVFCTRKLYNQENYGNWKQVPLNRLLVFKNGTRIYYGKVHRYEHKRERIIV